jgi:hypothetical protein
VTAESHDVDDDHDVDEDEDQELGMRIDTHIDIYSLTFDDILTLITVKNPINSCGRNDRTQDR